MEKDKTNNYINEDEDEDKCIHNGSKEFCVKCHYEEYKNTMVDKASGIEQAHEFTAWSDRDLSELFWIYLVDYKKNKDAKTLERIRQIYFWATHANPSLKISIIYALEWCSIDVCSFYK